MCGNLNTKQSAKQKKMRNRAKKSYVLDNYYSVRTRETDERSTRLQCRDRYRSR